MFDEFSDICFSVDLRSCFDIFGGWQEYLLIYIGLLLGLQYEQLNSLLFIKTEYAIVYIRHKTVDLLKNHTCILKTKLFVNSSHLQVKIT